MKLEDYVTVQDAGEETGIRYKTLLQRIKRGKVDHIKINRTILVPRAEVDRIKAGESKKELSINHRKLKTTWRSMLT